MSELTDSWATGKSTATTSGYVAPTQGYTAYQTSALGGSSSWLDSLPSMTSQAATPASTASTVPSLRTTTQGTGSNLVAGVGGLYYNPNDYTSNFDSLMRSNSGGTSTGTTTKSSQYYDDIRSVLGGLQRTEAPTYTSPTYTQPEFDQGRVDYYTQKAAAPGVSALRQGLRAAQQKANSYDNPNVTAMVEGSALGSYGQGLSSVMGSAQGAGLQRYTTSEYNPAVQAAQTNYAGDVAEAQASYQQGLSDYNTAQSLYYSLLPELFGTQSNSLSSKVSGRLSGGGVNLSTPFGQ